MIIDEPVVRRVAHLARLKLSDDEVARFTSQLSAIVGYIEQISKLDTSNVEPLIHALPTARRLRADECVAGLSAEQALANAPQRVDDLFKVPAVLDAGAGA